MTRTEGALGLLRSFAALRMQSQYLCYPIPKQPKQARLSPPKQARRPLHSKAANHRSSPRAPSPLAWVRASPHLTNIMVRFIFAAFLALIDLCHASVTAGWKIPIEQIAGNYKTNDRVHRLDEPPGKSAFFEEGDELWDVAKLIKPRIARLETKLIFGIPTDETPEFDWKGDWVVWNARSEMVIARGSPIDLRLIEDGLDFRKAPHVIRSRIEFEDPKGNIARTASFTSRSGEKTRFQIHELDAVIQVDSSDQHWANDVETTISWSLKQGGPRWEVHTHVSLRDNERIPLAQVGYGNGSRRVLLTVSRETANGTTWSKSRWRETKGGLKAWELATPRDVSFRAQLGDGRELGIASFPEGVDNLAKLGVQNSEEFLQDLTSIDVPNELAPLASGPLLDISHLLRNNGIATELAGYDPQNRTLIFIGDPTDLDLFEVVIDSMIGCWFSPLWIETNAESGGYGLVCRSSETARIYRTDKNPREVVFEVRPKERGDLSTIDITYQLATITDAQSIGRIASSTQLTRMIPQVIGSLDTDGQAPLKVTLEARYIHE